MGSDLGASVGLGLALRLVQACPEPGTQLKAERCLNAVGEAFPGGLFADAQSVADGAPGFAVVACLADEVIRHPVSFGRQRLAQGDGLVEALQRGLGRLFDAGDECIDGCGVHATNLGCRMDLWQRWVVNYRGTCLRYVPAATAGVGDELRSF